MLKKPVSEMSVSEVAHQLTQNGFADNVQAFMGK